MATLMWQELLDLLRASHSPAASNRTHATNTGGSMPPPRQQQPRPQPPPQPPQRPLPRSSTPLGTGTPATPQLPPGVALKPPRAEGTPHQHHGAQLQRVALIKRSGS